MVVLVSLIVDHPFPDLGAILTYLRYFDVAMK